MDPELYHAAIDGKHGFFDEISTSVEETKNYLEERTSEGDNILHVASRRGHAFFIAVAIKKLVAVSVILTCQKNDTGENPLHVAAVSGHLGVARLLVGAYKHYQQDVEGAKRKSSLLCLTLQEEGGVAAEPWRATDATGQMPLHKALKAGHEQLAIYLLEEDPELACFDTDGDESPLFLAAVFGHQNFAEKILASSTLYSLNGPSGATPLHVSVYSAAAENFVQLLLQKHPELIRKADKNKETALHHAAKTDQADIVEMIVRADRTLGPQNARGNTTFPRAKRTERSSANQRDADGLTPLLRAATMDLVQVVITILRYSPMSIAIYDSNGRTALHLMGLNSYHDGYALLSFPIIQRLVNEADHDGNTPLHLAIKRQDHIMANILLETVNIQPNIKNRNGLTPRDLLTSQQELSDDMVEIGYQLIMQERPRQVNSNPETIHGATMKEEIPAMSSEAIQERTHTSNDTQESDSPIEDLTQILEDASKSLQRSFNTLSVISSILAAVNFADLCYTWCLRQQRRTETRNGQQGSLSMEMSQDCSSRLASICSNCPSTQRTLAAFAAASYALV